MAEHADWLIRVRQPVQFRDCDPLGHVNNAVYLTYLENARFALWRAQGMEGVILARAEVDYRSQSRYGDELETRVRLEGFGRSSFRYAYEIVDVPTERLVIAARTVQVHFDYATQAAVELTDAIRQKLERKIEAI